MYLDKITCINIFNRNLYVVCKYKLCEFKNERL